MRFCDLWTRIGSRPMNLFNVHLVNVFVEQTRLTRSLMHPWWPCQICWIDSCWIRLINQTAPSLLFLYFFSFFFTFKFSSQITFRKLLTAWISDNIWFLFVDFLHVHLFDKYSIQEQFIFFYKRRIFGAVVGSNIRSFSPLSLRSCAIISMSFIVKAVDKRT